LVAQMTGDTKVDRESLRGGDSDSMRDVTVTVRVEFSMIISPEIVVPITPLRGKSENVKHPLQVPESQVTPAFVQFVNAKDVVNAPLAKALNLANGARESLHKCSGFSINY
jgi:hypothetical protein